MDTKTPKTKRAYWYILETLTGNVLTLQLTLDTANIFRTVNREPLKYSPHLHYTEIQDIMNEVGYQKKSREHGFPVTISFS